MSLIRVCLIEIAPLRRIDAISRFREFEESWEMITKVPGFKKHATDTSPLQNRHTSRLTMPSLELTYWDIPGRAEAIRVAFRSAK